MDSSIRKGFYNHVVLVVLLCLCLGVNNSARAQTEKVKAFNTFKANSQNPSENLLVAKAQIDAATKVLGADKDAETWYYKGLIYNAIAADPNLKETLHGTHPDLDAYGAYQKCLALDKNRTYINGIKEDYTQMAIDFLNAGTDAYDQGLNLNNDAGYLATAAQYYEGFLTIFPQLGTQQIFIDKMLKDSNLDINAIRFFCAVSLDRTGQTDKALSLYELLAKKNYSDALVYTRINDIYRGKGKTQDALQILKAASSRFSADATFALAYARALGQDNRIAEGIVVAESAIQIDKTAAAPYVVIAQLQEKANNIYKAEAAFKKAIMLQPEDFEPNYAIGRYYCNVAKQIEDKIPKAPTADTTDLRVEATEYYFSAISFLETAAEARPKDYQNLTLLLYVYQQTDNTKKADIVRSKLKNTFD